MSANKLTTRTHSSGMVGLLFTASMTMLATANASSVLIGTDQNALFGVDENIQSFLSANRGTNGGGDQSLQGGDALIGTEDADIIVGALGIDVLMGNGGSDILIGGTEDFNPFNRDRAFGGSGDDVFVWAPGDGNDLFDGGEGEDVLVLGLIGEERDAEGNNTGAPFFSVNPPSAAGSQDFDGIYIDPSSGLPIVDVAGGPGFCDVVDGADSDAEQTELSALGLEHLVRFTLRGPAADTSNPDTGLRIAIHLLNTEYLVCGSANAGEIVALDLTTSPPTPIDVSELPPLSFALIR
ncbi:MAG: calcium-binding protein [Granulosicoccus sp.]